MISIILGLSLAKLLQSAVKLVQHPGRTKPYWVHLLWSLYIFLVLIHFWWWEYSLKKVTAWSFEAYFFLILYITIYFTICALLWPDDIKDYDERYEDYFYSRKKWFFAVLALSFVADIVDTYLKKSGYFLQNTIEYPIRNVLHFAACIAAMYISNRRFHAVLVIAFILYELIYIIRLFNTIISPLPG
ncbi:MAG: hypothetical protein JST68_22960 [Bacteroidetes bacterium]|nr:hypothetical protein [Bacteroidota bacterium]